MPITTIPSLGRLNIKIKANFKIICNYLIQKIKKNMNTLNEKRQNKPFDLILGTPYSVVIPSNLAIK